jgi:cytochrome b subunit of formate dehydrogenase
MGPVWQTIIFVGGIVPALLAVTGIVMWLRSRGWRAQLARRRKSRLSPQPAE